MLKRQTWILLMLLIALVAFTGCSDDDDPVTPTPTDTFADVADAVGDVLNDSAVTPAVVSADILWADISSKAPTMTVVDVRSEEHYNQGHIPGAVHSSLGTLVSDLADGTIPTDLDYLVFACYSGQSAGHAKMAAELLGYQSKSLLFGMSAWSPDAPGGWSEAKCQDLLAQPETENQNDGLVDNAYPSMTDNLETRVAATLANGFKAISYTEDLDNSDTYFILNYWGQADYEGTGTSGTTGHIPGAFQFTPYTSLDMDAMLKNLPTDKQIIVYCWTGQHSSQVTFALNTMGYDALSLSYGSNSLMYTDLTAHKWSAGAERDYPLEATGDM